MADTQDRESKTLEPTETRLRKALDDGRTPAARDMALLASIAGLLFLLTLAAGDRVSVAFGQLALLFDNASWPALVPAQTAAIGRWLVASETMGLLALALGILASLGLAAGVAQGAPRLAWKRIRPQWSRVSPRAGLDRLFGGAGRMEFLKATAKFLVFALVVGIVGYREIAGLVDAVVRDPAVLPGFVLASSVRLVAAVAACTALLAIGDLFWSRFVWRRDLRMSHQDMKDEMKQQEGDPFVKSRRRSLALDRARRRMMAKVPGATLVVMNPTHYAVALRYDRAGPAAPVVVAKGLDLLALKIREIAERHGVPVVEDKPLARALHGSVELDQMIPPEFYRAVAELICLVAAPRAAAQAGAGAA